MNARVALAALLLLLPLRVPGADAVPVAANAEEQALYADDRIPAGARPDTPIDLAGGPDGAVFIANRDSGRILRLAPGAAAPVPWAALDRTPGCIAVDARSGLLYAGIGAARGELVAFDLATGRQRWRTVVGHTPRAILPIGDVIYVACQHDHAVVVVAAATGAPGRRYAVQREPVALARAGSRVLVVNALPLATADHGGVAARIDVIDPVAGTTISIPLPPGAHSARAIAVTSDGRRAFIPSVLSRYHLPTTQIERGWIQTSVLTVIDLERDRVAASFLLDDPDLGAAVPWGCALLPDARHLAIALSGSHAVMLIDLAGLEPLLAAGAARGAGTLGELRAIRRRIDLAPDQGVRALLPADRGVWYAAAFTDVLGWVPVQPEAPIRRLALGGTPSSDAARHGEAVFHDATLSAQGWLSCASCHPDGRADSLDWYRVYHGVGAFVNTKSLVGAVATPPTTWTGVRADARASAIAAFRDSLYREPEAAETAAVLDYISGLRYQPSPYRDRLDPALVERGRKLFTARSCIDCHDGPHLTDQEAYDVGTGTGADLGKKFDVPSLREAWRTAPYLHDGSALTLADAIRALLRDPRFRKRTGIQEDDIEALAAYVATL